jgi:hypothetical protein
VVAVPAVARVLAVPVVPVVLVLAGVPDVLVHQNSDLQVNSGS